MDRLDYLIKLYRQRMRGAYASSDTMRLYGIGRLENHPRVYEGEHLLLDGEKWKYASWQGQKGLEVRDGTRDPMRGKVVAVRWLAHQEYEINDAELVVEVDLDSINRAIEQDGEEAIFDFFWGG